MPLYPGADVIYTARFVPKKLIELMRKHKPNIFIAVPSMYGALLSVKSATQRRICAGVQSSRYMAQLAAQFKN